MKTQKGKLPLPRGLVFVKALLLISVSLFADNEVVKNNDLNQTALDIFTQEKCPSDDDLKI